MDFNSYQSIVYSACDILIRLMVEDSEYTIPKLAVPEIDLRFFTKRHLNFINKVI
jgi:hypothetical protein